MLAKNEAIGKHISSEEAIILILFMKGYIL